jgi:hypothetical protein
VFKRKTRSLSIRLSEEEYQRLLDEGLAEGAYSISDYAREMLFRYRAIPVRHDDLSPQLLKLEGDVRNVGRELKTLRERLGIIRTDG